VTFNSQNIPYQLTIFELSIIFL